MESIAVENLSFRYPNAARDTLRDVSFRVEAGDFAVLIGETGSGKSTLLRLLKRELAPLGERSGRVLLSGTPVEELSDRETLVKKVEIVPLEVIVRNVAAGSFSKRSSRSSATATAPRGWAT